MVVGIHLAMVCIICGNSAAGDKFGLVRKQGLKTLLALITFMFLCRISFLNAAIIRSL